MTLKVFISTEDRKDYLLKIMILLSISNIILAVFKEENGAAKARLTNSRWFPVKAWYHIGQAGRLKQDDSTTSKISRFLYMPVPF